MSRVNLLLVVDSHEDLEDEWDYIAEQLDRHLVMGRGGLVTTFCVATSREIEGNSKARSISETLAQYRPTTDRFSVFKTFSFVFEDLLPRMPSDEHCMLLLVSSGSDEAMRTFEILGDGEGRRLLCVIGHLIPVRGDDALFETVKEVLVDLLGRPCECRLAAPEEIVIH